MTPVVALVAWPAIGLWGIAIMFVSHALVVWGALTPTSRLLGPVVTDFVPEGREVWLTIDDGPDQEDTPRVLDLLDAHDARATFFVKGENAASHPELIREIVRRGHTIGNHSWSHPSGTFWCLGPSELRRQVRKCNDTIAELLGEQPLCFRAPVGMKNPFVHPVLREEGMKLVAWTSRGWDTVSRSPAEVARRIVKRLRPGAIILLHEGTLVSGLEGSEMIGEVVGRLSEEGYRCVIPRAERL